MSEYIPSCVDCGTSIARELGQYDYWNDYIKPWDTERWWKWRCLPCHDRNIARLEREYASEPLYGSEPYEYKESVQPELEPGHEGGQES